MEAFDKATERDLKIIRDHVSPEEAAEYECAYEDARKAAERKLEEVHATRGEPYAVEAQHGYSLGFQTS